MPLNQEERALHTLAITRIGTGEMPGVEPQCLWGGKGAGDPCALCGKHIKESEMEYEIQDGGERIFHLHLRCHAIWQLALSAPTPDSPRPPT